MKRGKEEYLINSTCRAIFLFPVALIMSREWGERILDNYHSSFPCSLFSFNETLFILSHPSIAVSFQNRTNIIRHPIETFVSSIAASSPQTQTSLNHMLLQTSCPSVAFPSLLRPFHSMGVCLREKTHWHSCTPLPFHLSFFSPFSFKEFHRILGSYCSLYPSSVPTL